MSPKPFPFPIGVGVDICHISRIAALLGQENVRNQWARKVFTRLEWPALCRKFEGANQLEGASVSLSEPEKNNTIIEDCPSDNVWMLPKLSKQSHLLDDSDLYWSTIADHRSKLAVLARYLAGRWAAKEAVVKAHRHRQLYMREISIVSLSGQSSNGKKATALVDPVCSTIGMDERVAKLRGLMGFTPQSHGLYKGASRSGHEPEQTTQGLEETSNRFKRRRKVQESDRQSAEINISHDGEYAVAVCMAFDSPNIDTQRSHVIDDGSGPPIHEPQWGDVGWFNHDDLSQDKTPEDVASYGLLDDPKSSMDPEAYGKALRELLRDGDDQEHWRIPPLPPLPQ